MSYVFEAVTRTENGTSAARRLRRENRLPAVVYGKGKEALSITLDHDPVLHAQENKDFYHEPFTVNVDGKAVKVRIKDIQRHWTKPKLVHLDLLRV